MYNVDNHSEIIAPILKITVIGTCVVRGVLHCLDLCGIYYRTAAEKSNNQ